MVKFLSCMVVVRYWLTFVTPVALVLVAVVCVPCVGVGLGVVVVAHPAVRTTTTISNATAPAKKSFFIGTHLNLLSQSCVAYFLTV